MTDQEFMTKVMTGKTGLKCPFCGSLVSLYKRTINAEMAKTFLQLVRAYNKYPRYYSMRELKPADNKAASDIIYLLHWGLLDKTDSSNSAMAPAGTYRPTEKGLRFAHNLIRVPSHVHLLHNEVVGWSDKTIDIKTALGTKFNYEDLMR